MSSKNNPPMVKCAFPECSTMIPQGKKPNLCEKHCEWRERWLFNLWLTEDLKMRMAQARARAEAAPKLVDGDGKPIFGVGG